MAKAIRDPVRNGKAVSTSTLSQTIVDLARSRRSVRARSTPAMQAELESIMDQLRAENRQLRVQLRVATGCGVHTPVTDILRKVEQTIGAIEILLVAHDDSIDPPDKKDMRKFLYMMMDSMEAVNDTISRYGELVLDGAAKEVVDVG